MASFIKQREEENKTAEKEEKETAVNGWIIERAKAELNALPEVNELSVGLFEYRISRLFVAQEEIASTPPLHVNLTKKRKVLLAWGKEDEENREISGLAERCFKLCFERAALIEQIIIRGKQQNQVEIADCS